MGRGILGLLLPLALTLAFSPAWAQAWTADGLVRWRVSANPYQRLDDEPYAVARVGEGRRILQALGWPSHLDSAGIQLTWWRGEAWVFGRRHHPAMLPGNLMRLLKAAPVRRRSEGPLTLLRSRAFGPWEPFATYHPDRHGRAWAFYPLGDGSFLASASTGHFYEGGHRSRFAVFAREADGRLGFRRLVDLGAEGEAAWWTVHRTPRGILLCSFQGRLLRLSDQDARVEATGDLYPGQPLPTGFTPNQVIDAVLDGRGQWVALVRVRRGAGIRQQPGFPQRTDTASSLQARWVLRRVLKAEPEEAVPCQWIAVDPATLSVRVLPAPKGWKDPGPISSNHPFHIRMEPDGGLAWGRPRMGDRLMP